LSVVERELAFLAAAMPRLRLQNERIGGAALGRLLERRYENIPPEAFPILETGCDGCAYALFIDDFAQTWVPPVVLTSPMDRSTLQQIAPDARSFIELVERMGVWPEHIDDPVWDLAQRAAIAAREKTVTHPTTDGLGVVSADDMLGRELAAQRDAIHGSERDPPAIARAYRALGREAHARVVEVTYGQRTNDP
jgi:hypothetical protein